MRKIQYLDGLRGLAAFVVVFHHFIYAFYPALILGSEAPIHLKAGLEAFLSGSAVNLLYNGNFAVCIFFVLSGFVLSHKFFLKKDRDILTESVVKRYLRLVVPVAFSVLVTFILMKLSLFCNQQAAAVSGSEWLGSFWTFRPNFFAATHEAFVGAFFQNTFDYNMTLWTIAYELFGSFLVFAFLALFGKMKHRSVAYAVAIVVFFQTYYLAFILGVLLSDLVAHRDVIIRQFDRSKFLRAGMLIAGLFLGAYPSGRSVGGTIYASMEKDYLTDSAVLYHIIGAFCVILVLLESKRLQKLFSVRPLLFLGEISFAMYLLHFTLLGSFSSFVFLALAPHMPYADAVIASFLLSVGLLFLVSRWTFLHVDKNAIRFSKFVYIRVFRMPRADKSAE